MMVLAPGYKDDAKLRELRSTDFYKEVVRDFVPTLKTVFGRHPKAEGGNSAVAA